MPQGSRKFHLNAEEKKRLGLDRPITRRDFGKLMMVGAASLLIPGCTGLTSQSGTLTIGGNTDDSRFVCHQVRDAEHLSQGAE